MFLIIMTEHLITLTVYHNYDLVSHNFDYLCQNDLVSHNFDYLCHNDLVSHNFDYLCHNDLVSHNFDYLCHNDSVSHNFYFVIIMIEHLITLTVYHNYDLVSQNANVYVIFMALYLIIVTFLSYNY